MSISSGVDSDIELKPEQAAEDARGEYSLSSIPHSNPNSTVSTSSAHVMILPKDEPDDDVGHARTENSVAVDGTKQARQVRVHALSKKQERKLVEYVEDKFLDVMRNFKKR